MCSKMQIDLLEVLVTQRLVCGDVARAPGEMRRRLKLLASAGRAGDPRAVYLRQHPFFGKR